MTSIIQQLPIRSNARVTASRYHDFSCGHRVYGHESKCKHLHGHNYRITFEVEAPALDVQGRVVDFSVIKSHLCIWLEENWDHKFLLWEKDPMLSYLLDRPHPQSGVLSPKSRMLVFMRSDMPEPQRHIVESFVAVPFNPTAENMALHLLRVIGPYNLQGTGVTLTKVTVEETRKCSAVAELPPVRTELAPAAQGSLGLE